MPLNTSKTFSMKIEQIVLDKNITHMEAVLWYCEQEGLEFRPLRPLISKTLKEKIEANAKRLKFFTKMCSITCLGT